MPRKKAETNEVGTLDYETDPFLYGRVPKPFVAGVYRAGEYKEIWGDDCVRGLVDYLDSIKTPTTFYAHNGGKFDFFLMLEYLENPITIISGRIVKAKIGIHTLQDSYAILPIPLRVFDKDDIDYQKLEKAVRHKHTAEISKYLKKDCTSLFDLVSKFRNRFGDRLTIGGTAMGELRKIHPFESQRLGHDTKFRPFYFGGRVEAMERGIIKGKFKVYDINSSYPKVMRDYDHPTGATYKTSYGGIMDKKGNISGHAGAAMFFAKIHCKQRGAFPIRRANQPLDFNCPEGEFFVTSHELKAAVETGRVWDVKVIECLSPAETIRFTEYVDIYSAEKIAAKAAGEKANEIFAKLLLNTPYGKFGQNPEYYFDYMIQGPDDEIPDEPYEIYLAQSEGINIWRKHSNAQAFYDVATAASITGAARAVLMRGLSASTRAVYCDTDSIICEEFAGDLDESRLGAWKLEAEGDAIAIAGKKLYALRDKKEYVKIASKGVRLTGPEIFDICRGKSIEWHNDAPSFSLSNGVRFVHRKIKSRV